MTTALAATPAAAASPVAIVPARPILFSAPMVRAILDNRKTQTRRLVRAPKGFTEINQARDQRIQWRNEHHLRWMTCPHGTAGDALWVREGFRYWRGTGERADLMGPTGVLLQYAADAAVRKIALPEGIMPTCSATWKPGIHLPRWASRITLEIASVRVERVARITEEDALAEGITRTSGGFYTFNNGLHEARTARDAFRALWNSLNETRAPFDSNPLVWVIEFRNTTPADAPAPAPATGSVSA